MHRYDASLKDDEPFFFNIKEDAQGEVPIQSGEPLIHPRIYITSKKLMRNAEKHGVHHYDGTYKLSRNGFIVVVWGVTDIQGQFHPIAFALVSNEQESDFTDFFDGLLGK